jgi:hypothetical protein
MWRKSLSVSEQDLNRIIDVTPEAVEIKELDPEGSVEEPGERPVATNKKRPKRKRAADRDDED